MSTQRTAFFVSDRTGITAELLGKGLLSQFAGIEFRRITLPFVDTEDKAREVAAQIAQAGQVDGARPVVFSTLTAPVLRKCIAASGALFLDLFDMFIGPLETELSVASAPTLGLAHGMGDHASYTRRIDAMNYALNYDDGARTAQLGNADIILVGVSRCGKTPTCLYLALQFGLQAANFPLTPDDFNKGRLPESLEPHRSKLFGLTIDAVRLQQIRSERRQNSQYASLENCRYEVAQAEAMFKREGIHWVDTSTMSVEEIAVTVLHKAGLAQRK
jgi:regulator of PEP synthase PpsR (kinase-PPPase family)